MATRVIKSDKAVDIEVIIESVSDLKTRETLARRKIEEGERELEALKTQRQAVRHNLEKIVNELIPKRQRRRKETAADQEMPVHVEQAISAMR